MQYEVLWVDWCENTEKHKLLAESLVPRYQRVKHFDNNNYCIIKMLYEHLYVHPRFKSLATGLVWNSQI